MESSTRQDIVRSKRKVQVDLRPSSIACHYRHNIGSVWKERLLGKAFVRIRFLNRRAMDYMQPVCHNLGTPVHIV